MSTEQNKAVLRRWMEGYNKGNADLQVALADEVFSPTLSATASAQPWRTSSSLRAWLSTAAPENMITLDDMIAEGDKVGPRYGARCGPSNRQTDDLPDYGFCINPFS